MSNEFCIVNEYYNTLDIQPRAGTIFTMHSHGFIQEHSGALIWLMRLLDCLILLGASLVAYLPVFGTAPLPAHYQVALLFSVLLLIVVFHAFSLYRAWRGIDYTQELTATLLAWTTVFAILVFLSFITKSSVLFSRAWLVMWFTFGAVALLLARYTLRKILQKLRGRGFNLRHIAIIASGEIGNHVLDRLRAAPETGFNVRAYFTDDQIDTGTLGKITHGPISEALSYLELNAIDQVWLAMPLRQADVIETVVNRLKNVAIDVRLVPDLFGFRLINHSISPIAGLSVVNLSISPMEGVNRWVKAIEDKAVSALVLLLISPVFLTIATAVRVSSPGPVFYRQKRLSWNGRAFTMYKFRTMPVNSEQETGAVWTTDGDSRPTAVGVFLRKTSLDELPQFWNVLRGDMSVVGPRPERPVFVDKFKEEIPGYMQKHMVKAGITGWAQVNGWRGDTDLQSRVEHDLYYIDNWSLWLDLRIMLLTVFGRRVHNNAY
ncbi:MAG: undecaprenyl-phosphate glucose phosphotransferase [Halieaceae bacterium]|nr:undecaprenyl-phosphate glucose phosphotransferase [Halieaceae bacterium]